MIFLSTRVKIADGKAMRKNEIKRLCVKYTLFLSDTIHNGWPLHHDTMNSLSPRLSSPSSSSLLLTYCSRTKRFSSSLFCALFNSFRLACYCWNWNEKIFVFAVITSFILSHAISHRLWNEEVKYLLYLVEIEMGLKNNNCCWST